MMRRTAERITDDLDTWRKRNEHHLSSEADAQLARLLHELRALEKGHDTRTCEDCEHYDIDQLTTPQRITGADSLRVRILTKGYPLPDVPRPTCEQIRHSLIAGTRRAQLCAALGWSEEQVITRLWELFPVRMRRAGYTR